MPSLSPGVKGTVEIDPITGQASGRGKIVLHVPALAAGANKVMLDLWNGSTVPLVLRTLKAIKDGSVAVTGALSEKFIATRTSAVGTGGTAAVAEGTDPTVPALSLSDPAGALPSGVSARAAPAGGATAGAVLSEGHVFPEETNDSMVPSDLIYTPIVIPPGTGFRVVQGAVASVGNTAFNAVMDYG
jgi:hypothetical protein